MKKSIISILVVILLVAGLFILTGCENKNTNNEVNNNETKSTGIDLKYDFEHINNKTYNAHINTSSDDKIAEFDEEEPNSARIENEKDNYVLELTLETESKEAYEQFQSSAKEENDLYKEVKYGKYDGYYSDDNGDIYGYILLDTSDSTFNVYVMFNLYLLDEDSDNNDVEAIYQSSSIQNILNKIEFKTSK